MVAKRYAAYARDRLVIVSFQKAGQLCTRLGKHPPIRYVSGEGYGISKRCAACARDGVTCRNCGLINSISTVVLNGLVEHAGSTGARVRPVRVAVIALGKG